jgi:hypothetical protein
MTTLKVLPAETKPFKHKIERTHSPKQATRYRQFRDCLRWEFGFTCAFCLLHEADLVFAGIDGSGMTQIEHFKRQKTHPRDILNYENCFYICIYCNRDRGIKPHLTGTKDKKLLNPCDNTWANHFELQDHHLNTKSDDVDGNYTLDTYNLNNPIKVKLRKIRQKKLTQLLKISALFHRLLLRIEEGESELLEDAREVQKVLRDMRLDVIEQYEVIPADVPRSCRCEATPAYQLPVQMEDQVQRLNP